MSDSSSIASQKKIKNNGGSTAQFNNAANKNLMQLAPLKMDSTECLKSIDDQQANGNIFGQNNQNKIKLNPINVNLNGHYSKKELIRERDDYGGGGYFH